MDSIFMPLTTVKLLSACLDCSPLDKVQKTVHLSLRHHCLGIWKFTGTYARHISHRQIDTERAFIELKQGQTLGLLNTPQVFNNRQTPSDGRSSLLSNRD